MDKLPATHVVVRFGSAIPGVIKGEALLAFERHLRLSGVEAEVFCEPMKDQNKLRRLVTQEDAL